MSQDHREIPRVLPSSLLPSAAPASTKAPASPGADETPSPVPTALRHGSNHPRFLRSAALRRQMPSYRTPPREPPPSMSGQVQMLPSHCQNSFPYNNEFIPSPLPHAADDEAATTLFAPIQPLVQACWKLKPPVIPSTSRISPAK